ncbi:MAG TPA: alpha/beta hydrolase [Baekduia sp.]
MPDDVRSQHPPGRPGGPRRGRARGGPALRHRRPGAAHDRAAARVLRVVAPDYRGAGLSSRPADDVHRLLRDHLDIEGPVVLVGHDVGAIIASTFAQAFCDEVSHLVLIDGPLPGTEAFPTLRADPWMWDVAGAAPIAGPLRRYLLGYFAGCAHAGSLDAVDVETYVSAYDRPRAMAVARELFAAFERDAAESRAALRRRGRLTIPVLAIGGATSAAGPHVAAMAREVACDVTSLRVPGAGHWIADEQPQALTRAVVAFAAVHSGRALHPAAV